VTTNSNTKSTGIKISGKTLMNTSHSSNHGGNIDMMFLRQVQAQEVPDESGVVIESRRNSFLNDASNENKSQGSGDRYTPVYYHMDFNESKVQSNDSFYHNDNDRDRDVKRDKDGDSNKDGEKEKGKEKEKDKEKENLSPSTGGEYFGETYSLIRERNSLLARLEQVIITLVTTVQYSLGYDRTVQCSTVQYSTVQYSTV
jgi:hypothetical protein